MDTSRLRTAHRSSTLPRTTLLVSTLITALAVSGLTGQAVATDSSGQAPGPHLVGRAVLPYNTLAEGPQAGNYVIPGPGIVNHVTFPLPAQPVEGFSSIVDGRSPGELLAMPDNGFGSKANSRDFLIRAYYLRPDFKTARGGSGSVEVGDFISFSDPDHQLPFPIVNEGSTSRLLTGADIDPESLQRDHHGDLWVGDEFGPWILHFDDHGRLLAPPFDVPGIKSPNNPTLAGAAATQPNSRGFEAMAISPNGKDLYAALEGATVADPDKQRRNIYEFSINHATFTGRVLHYRTESPATLVSDMGAVGGHRLALIERDAGSGLTATFRQVYRIDLTDNETDGFLPKTPVLDLTAIPDPDAISLPPIHPGDVGLGDPFSVTCESVEALHPLGGHRLLIGCDNNLPNSGRNPTMPDDTELILVAVPGLGRG